MTVAPPGSAADVAPRRSRVLFVDFARATAVLFMIQGHTINVLLVPGYEENVAFGVWLFLRGLTSCLFLLLSGFAFGVVTDRHWDDFLQPSRRLAKRLGRFGFFLAFGYLLHFPMARFEHLQFADEERWRSFLQVDILQVVAVSLLTLQGLVALARTRERFIVGCTAAAAAAVLITPFIWGRPWTGVLPLWLASFMSAETGSLFPFFPWGGFLFIGAALGLSYAQHWQDRPAVEAVRALAWSGLALVALGFLLILLPFQPYGPIDLWKTSPTIFAIRLGCVLLLLAGFIRASGYIRRLPGVLQALAEESLTIYVAHVVVLYGSVWTRGLGATLGRQDLGGTALWILVLLVSMTVLAFVWNWTKRLHPFVTNGIRLLIAYYMLRPLL
ncbi:MAG: heparan-alpha-glucosaminide N-acetyltransferase domain-containing protein [Vicinamibacterales bacterium]